MIAFYILPQTLGWSIRNGWKAEINLLIKKVLLVSLAFTMSLGSVYACTMYYTLIRRECIRGPGIRESWIEGDAIRTSSSLPRLIFNDKFITDE